MQEPTNDTEKDEAERPSEKPSIKLWISRIESAKRAAKGHWGDAKASWDESLAGRGGVREEEQLGTEPKNWFPIFWASVKCWQTMLYSRIPIPVGEAVVDDLPDAVARLSCLSVERLGKYFTRRRSFHRTFLAARDQFIHANKVTTRVCVEHDEEEEEEKVYFTAIQSLDPQTQQPITQFVAADGSILPNPEALEQDENGFFIAIKNEEVKSISIDLECPHYRDILHNPDARNDEEIWWRAYRTELTRPDFEEKFGAELALKMPFAERGTDEGEKKESDDSKQLAERTVTVWNIHNKRKRELYWIVEGYNDDFIAPVDYPGGDAYELSGFFASPPEMIGTCGPDDLYPVPDYIQLRPLINQLHGLYRSLRGIIRGLRRRGIYDEGVTELKRLENALDHGEFIGVSDFKELIGEGGLENIVKYFPVGELSKALQETVAVSEQLEAKLDMLYGIPDIMRGTTDPRETAAAQQQKGQYLSLRATVAMQDFQRLIRDSLELQIDLALKMFSEEKLVDIMSVRRWAPEDQALWPQVLTLLRNDKERKVRIAIETDSTVTTNENAEIEQRQFLASTISELTNSIGAVAQYAPEMKPVMLKAAQLLLRGVRAGKEVEAEVEKAIQAAMNPQPQPEQPDPALVKAQIDQQMQQEELAFKREELQQTLAMKGQELAIQQQKIGLDAEHKAYTAQVDALTSAFEKKFQALELQFERQRLQLEMYEKLLEERRLAHEDAQRESEGKAQQKSTPVTIHMSHGPAPAPRKRKARMTRPDGTFVDIETEDIPDENHKEVSLNG